jgi:glycine reductase
VSPITVVHYEVVRPAPPLRNLAGARLALITTGGLAPKGNPDRLERGNSKVCLWYSIAGLAALSARDRECVHRAFYATIVNDNPNYVLPLDLAREFQAEGVFREIYPI